MSCSTLNLTIACQPGFGGHDLPSLVGDRPQGKLIKIWFPSSCLLIIGEAVLPVHAFVCVCVCVCVCVWVQNLMTFIISILLPVLAGLQTSSKSSNAFHLHVGNFIFQSAVLSERRRKSKDLETLNFTWTVRPLCNCANLCHQPVVPT